MAKIDRRTDIDDLVIRARMDADALGQLYELYYSLYAKRYPLFAIEESFESRQYPFPYALNAVASA